MDNGLEKPETGDRETNQLGVIAVVQGRVAEGFKKGIKQLSNEFHQCREPIWLIQRWRQGGEHLTLNHLFLLA